MWENLNAQNRTTVAPGQPREAAISQKTGWPHFAVCQGPALKLSLSWGKWKGKGPQVKTSTDQEKLGFS